MSYFEIYKGARFIKRFIEKDKDKIKIKIYKGALARLNIYQLHHLSPPTMMEYDNTRRGQIDICNSPRPYTAAQTIR